MSCVLKCVIVIARDKMNHEESILRVCFGCFSKAKDNDILSAATATIQDRVKLLLPSVPLEDDRCPKAFCQNCRSRLKKVESKIISVFDLSILTRHLETQPRTSPRTKCSCKICEVANESNWKTGKKQRKPGRPKEKEEEEVPRCCGKCYSPIYRGCVHKCSRTSMIENIRKNAPQRVQQRVASAVVREAAAESESSSITLPTGGQPLRLSVGTPKEVQEIQFTHEQMDDAQAYASLTGSQTLKSNCRDSKIEEEMRKKNCLIQITN